MHFRIVAISIILVLSLCLIMSIASPSPSEIWNEETARQTPFILDRPRQKQQAQQQHLFFTISSTTTENDEKISTILKLHNPQTREVFDRINVDDIIGVQLEIAMDVSKDDDDDGDDRKRQRERDEKAQKGQEEMETLEQNVQRHLLEDEDNDDAQMPMMPSSSSSSSAYLHIYAYPQASPKQSLFQKLCTNNDENEYANDNNATASPRHRHAHHRKIKLATNNPNSNAMEDFDFANVRGLIQSIRQLANIDLKPYSKRYLVMVNPFSGTKQGQQVYDTIVKKMLEEAGIDHDVFITERAGHATDRMLEQNNNDDDAATVTVRDVSEYDAIIAMGGDGILAEILQGLRKRSDYDVLMRKINFGIIGCGTSNGLAASILHAKKEKYGRLESTFVICKGNLSNMDLSVYQTATNESFYTSFLTYSWGMIADIDIESEMIRFLGELRNDVWAVWRLINLRTYKGKFSYLPAPTNTCTVGKNDAGVDDDINRNAANARSSANIQPNMPDIKSDELTSDWISFEAEFFILWASHVTHAATKSMHSPDSTLDDGIFKVLIVRRPCSRFELTKILLGFETGSHVSNPKAKFIDCVAFRLDPISSGSFSNIDGEVVEPGRIQAYVQPSAIRFFS